MSVATHKVTTPPHEQPGTTTQPTMVTRGVRWYLRDNSAAAITSHSAPDWFGLGDDPRAELVKRNPLREVYRVRLSGGVFFAKVFEHGGPVATLKRWITGPPAQREFRLAQALSDARIGTIRAVAAGIARSSRRSALISEEFSGAQTLARLWERSGIARRLLLECVAVFLAKTHAAHVLPRDTHPDNLLLRPGTVHGEWEFAYADLAGMRVGPPVADPEAAHNLAELYQWFHARSTVTQRLRFLRAYVNERFGGYRQTWKPWVFLLEAAIEAHQRKLWAKRDGRILATNTYFARADLSDNWTAHLVLRCRDDGLGLTPFEGERTPAQWQHWLGEYLPDLAGTLPAGLPEDLGLQRRRADRWRDFWWLLAGTPLRHTFVWAHRLRHRDLPAWHLPALFERRPWGEAAECVLLVHRPIANEPLRETARRLSEDRVRAAQTGGRSRAHRRLLRATAHLLADMVQRGVVAPSLTLDAFAVVPGPDPDQPIVCISDFRGLRVHRRPVPAVAAWMPACLLRECPSAMTRADRLRFLLSYRYRLPRALRGSGWKTLWKRIEAFVTD
ncbi:MAG: lipopolysaccharide kinase InaA family protein [Planctomycetota bacterium]